jgi:hypothetical protein
VKKRVLMVMTRDIPPEVTNGRERTLSFIRNAIGADAELSEFKIRSVFESGSLFAKLGALFRLAQGLLRGTPCAVQVAMFSRQHAGRELLDAIRAFKPDVIYFDGIRLVDYAALVRLNLPGHRLIMDFDDLMSRRATILREADFPLSAGYLTKSIPGPVVRIVNSRLLRHALLHYEELALKHHERTAVENSNVVTLVSKTDATALTQLLAGAAVKKVHVIAPPMNSVKPVYRPAGPIRFVFIGSDRQLQNRLAIQYLLVLWKRLAPAIPLVIYGRMVGQYESVPNVKFAGFAKTQADVYTEGSIALCPAFMRGGIKSKVLEAISYGCVPVGNEIAFEGLGFHDPALAMNESVLEQFVSNPLAGLDPVMEAAGRFAAYCDRNYSTQVFGRRWRELLAPALSVHEASFVASWEPAREPSLESAREPAQERAKQPELVEGRIFSRSRERHL